MFVDSHCHIYNEYYDDVDKVIKDSKKGNTNIIISAGVDQKTNEELLKYAQKHPNLYICLGIHPENVGDFNDADLN